MLDSDRPPGNRLGEETSPYLLQHKDNPVHWYAWGPDAFAAAQQNDKPILLSIGYAACHWCHVMAHESFENGAIAALMNQLFVNIKVDREERPDLDTIYQSSLSLLGEFGGWPLTMFLTPDAEPFWGGTYFPAEPRYGRSGFPDLLRGIAKAYGENRDAVTENVEALRQALQKMSSSQSGEAITLAMSDRAAERLLPQFDPLHGGIAQAPKFPQVSLLKLLWRAWKRGGNESYRDAVDLTLTKICQGGIYDHLGGGFARYSVDERWLVPHFEKMLYDNAQMIEALTWLWQETGKPLYQQRLRETVGWALREMIARADSDDQAGALTGAFASTLDADSEGVEGKFYVWDETEIDALLGADARLFKAAYDVTPEGNWEGKTILNRSADPGLGEAQDEAKLAILRATLLAARAKRVWPGWDDKVLADWNGLMIAALARAAPVFGEPTWLTAAQEAFRFVIETMHRKDRLRHSWRRGVLKHPATLEDYANLSEAALVLFEATGEAGYLAQAEAWVAVLDAHYWDEAGGGYFFTAADTERLIVRTKSAADNAVPSGNGTMAGVLATLYYQTGEERYRQRAEAVITAFSGELERNFFAYPTLLGGSEMLLQATQVVIVGERSSADCRALIDATYRVCLPNRVLQVVAEPAALPQGHPAAGKGQVEGTATAYVCRATTCSLPITDAEELRVALGG